MTSPGPICIGEKCKNYEIIQPWGAGCVRNLPANKKYTQEWTRLDRLSRCPGIKTKTGE
jgi:hypothetical protein